MCKPAKIACSISLTFSFFLIGFSSGCFAQSTSEDQESRADRSKQEAHFSEDDLHFFETNVRPILVERCYECHGPEADHLSGGLNLGNRNDIVVGGDSGPAIVVGNATASLLVESVLYAGDFEMPPSGKLSAAEIEILKTWVDRGAPWPDVQSESVAREKFDLAARKSDHWCWQPLKKTAPPSPDNDWSANPIDQFIYQKLQEHSLTPAWSSEREILIRRAYFDLVGLAPTPDKVAAFVKNPSESAFDSVVDELLAEPSFGEHWARHWMDLVRYAETYGHEFDHPIPYAFEYRDYLIRAFNANVPYDQFVREHLAGDLIENPRRHPTEQFNESVIGTGFWFFGEAMQAPVDVREDEAKRIENQIDVMTKTFLGLTVACARCHDHKFDAISAEDYYALVGFLQSSRRQIAMLDPDDRIEDSRPRARELVLAVDKEIEQLCKQLSNLDGAYLGNYLEVAILLIRDLRAEKIQETDLNIATKKAASNSNLDEAKLNRLIAAVQAIPVDKSNGWLRLVGFAIDPAQALDKTLLDRIIEDHAQQRKQENSFRNESVSFAQFDKGLPGGWFIQGSAFRDAIDPPAEEPVHRLGAVGPILKTQTSLDSGRWGGKFCGVLYSPTFTIEYDQIHLLVRGSKTEVRLVVDGYFMNAFSDLLFVDLKKPIESEQEFVWLTVAGDLKNHRGHKAHLEIIDHQDGYFEIAEIRFSNSSQPPRGNISKFDFGDLELIDQSFAKAAQEIFTRQLAGELDQGANSLLPWIIEHELMEMVQFSQIQTRDFRHPLMQQAISISEDRMSSGHSRTGLMETVRQIKSKREELTRLNAVTPLPRFALAITDGTGEDEHIFIRGNHKTLGDVAVRRFLSAFSSEPINPPNGSGRLSLANSVADASNPLTARVIVNRVWHHLMGRGIVESVDNFGALGHEPSHPELLDFLAIQFMEDGWNMKRLIRRIMLSKTYQMSNRSDLQTDEIDPANRLFHCANLKQLHGESIRDNLLVVSGELDRTMFGRSVPIHLTSFMEGRGRPTQSGPLDGERRRSIYVEVRRNFLSPLMLAFDTPAPFNAIGNRNRSNVPSQALILMNDPFVIQQVEIWSKRLVEQGLPVRERIESIYQTAFGRTPTPWETEEAEKFLQSQAEILKLSTEQISESDVLWKDFCHIVVNLKEFRFVR